MNPELPGGQQYCLKWNNHKNNISGVFERLRADESFVDVTLASADQKTLRCHRILLSAGSGYLEEILSQNPSDHPTIVLSQINFNELKHLVDFMYAGEVAVEQDSLNILLEAAKILKIKGLWESGLDPCKEEEEEEEPETVVPQVECPSVPSKEVMSKEILSKDPPVSPSMPELKSPPSIAQLKSMMQVMGSKRRKRSRNGGNSIEEMTLDGPKQTKIVKKDQNESPITTPSKMYSPLFGVSNAYFLTQPPPLKTILENASSASNTNATKTKNIEKNQILSNSCSPALQDNLMKDIPNLLSQTPIHPNLISAMNSNSLPFLPNVSGPGSSSGNQSDNDDKSSVKSLKFPAGLFASATPVRRYKQYTEDTLQLALKEIMDGQSINRSSMKYNVPARTLRDWMKRLNIKSVFTHHSQQKDERGISLDSNPDDNPMNGNVFPGMMTLGEAIRAQNNKSGPLRGSDQDEDDEEEEEIDDDEEERLKVDEN